MYGLKPVPPQRAIVRLFQKCLGLAVVMMTVVVMMRSRGKGRGSEHQDQEHCSEDLLHGVNLA